MFCWPVCLFSFVIAIQVAEAGVSRNFYSFMVEKYGTMFAESVARRDFGPFGSFGGGNHKAGTKTNHTPVIFVHGWNANSAAYQPLSAFWLLNGYKSEELYGNSYGEPWLPGGLGTFEAYQWGLQFKYIKTIRNLIIAVSDYTNSTVNVLSYSMGGPVSRKAILGGKCVDTGEDLGPPLTERVEAYLGVAGAMKGAMLCLAPLGICSPIDGMLCGSKFMKDINSVKRYEGKRIYVMQSVSDEIVGYFWCGGHPSEIAGADKTITLFGFLHLGIIGLTGPLQYSLVSRGVVADVPKGQKIIIK